MGKYLLVSLFTFILCITAVSQDTVSLKVGAYAPPLVLPTEKNTVQSFTFPYNNRIVLIYFWSSSVTKSKENIYKYSFIDKLYSAFEYKSCDGFEMISVAIQSDRNAWQEDINKYDLTNGNNCIALKGYSDMFIKSYKLTQVPSSFLIDEFGKIIAVNPDVKTIIQYLDQRKNAVTSSESQPKISGKVIFGENDLKPLVNEKLYMIDQNLDTIQTTYTNENGSFTLNNPNTDVSISISKSTQIKQNDQVLLTNEKGNVISAFTKGDKGFVYKLLDLEMSYLKPLAEGDVNFRTDIRNLFFSENLFKNGGFDLSKESKLKLNMLILKLNQNPKTRVEVISHSDSRGNATFNKELSLKQSVAICNYFMSKGIDRDRLMPIGRGEEEPLNKCTDGVKCTIAEYEENRRTEFKFYIK